MIGSWWTGIQWSTTSWQRTTIDACEVTRALVFGGQFSVLQVQLGTYACFRRLTERLTRRAVDTIAVNAASTSRSEIALSKETIVSIPINA
jgi:hypothetical protein